MTKKEILEQIIEEVGISVLEHWQQEARHKYYLLSDKIEKPNRSEFEYHHILHRFNNYVVVKYASKKAGEVC